MKQAYPKMLPCLARRAGVPERRAEKLWIEALRAASAEAPLIESPRYWKAAVDQLLDKLKAESATRRAAPFGWGGLIRLPARQWFHGLSAVEAMLAVGFRTGNAWARRCCH